MLFQCILFFTVEQADVQNARLYMFALKRQVMFFNPLGKSQQR